MNTITANGKETFDLTVQYITEELDVHSIYLFGKRCVQVYEECIFREDATTELKSNQFYLFVITMTTCRNLSNLHHKLETIEDEALAYTLIIRSQKEVNKALHLNNRFFHTILKHVKPVYSSAIPIDLTTRFNPETDYLTTLSYWNSCYKKAMKARDIAFLCQELEYKPLKSSEINNPLFQYQEQVSTAIHFMANALTHTCLGLIFVFLGYKPLKFSLSNLLDLCQCIDPEIKNLIPRVTEEDEFHYQLFDSGKWNAKIEDKYEPDISLMDKRLGDFINRAKIESLTRLKIQI